MSLVNCLECGKEVSNRAAACPHCGNPLDRIPPTGGQKKPVADQLIRLGCLLTILITIPILILLVIGMLAGG